MTTVVALGISSVKHLLLLYLTFRRTNAAHAENAAFLNVNSFPYRQIYFLTVTLLFFWSSFCFRFKYLFCYSERVEPTLK